MPSASQQAGASWGDSTAMHHSCGSAAAAATCICASARSFPQLSAPSGGEAGVIHVAVKQMCELKLYFSVSPFSFSLVCSSVELLQVLPACSCPFLMHFFR